MKSPKKEKHFIVVRSRVNGGPYKVHASLDIASTEARRLADLLGAIFLAVEIRDVAVPKKELTSKGK